MIADFSETSLLGPLIHSFTRVFDYSTDKTLRIPSFRGRKDSNVVYEDRVHPILNV